MTGAVAAMADPPQIEVPTPVNMAVLPATFRALPAKQAVKRMVADCKKYSYAWGAGVFFTSMA